MAYGVSVEWLKGETEQKETSPVRDDTELIPEYVNSNEQSVAEYIDPPDDLKNKLLHQSTGENILCLRKAYKLSRKDLSEKVEIHADAIRDIENPNSGYFPTNDMLLKLAKFFHIEPQYIKGRSLTQEELLYSLEESLSFRLKIAFNKLDIIDKQKIVEQAEKLTYNTKYQKQKITPEDE